MGSRHAQFPDEIYLLHILHNIGAIDPGRALALEEIARWASMEPKRAEENLNKLIGEGYAEIKVVSGAKRYYVTANGIRKVLSIYS